MYTIDLQVGRDCSISFSEAAILLATGIATSGQVQLRKSAIHGLPVTLRMLRVKSDKSDWFCSRSIVFTKPFKTRMSLDLARGPDFPSACQKGPLGTRLGTVTAVSFECRKVIDFALTTLRDGLKKLAPIIHPVRSEPRRNRHSLAHVFPRFA